MKTSFRTVLLLCCMTKVATAQQAVDLAKYAARAIEEQKGIIDSIKTFSIPEAEKKLEAASQNK